VNLFDTCRLQIGAFRLRTVGKVTEFQHRLGLWDALSTGTITTDKGKIGWRAFMHATQPLVVLEFTTEGAEKDFRLEWKPLSNSSPRWETFKDKPNLKNTVPADYIANPPLTQERAGNVSLSVHPLRASTELLCTTTGLVRPYSLAPGTCSGLSAWKPTRPSRPVHLPC